MDSQVFANQNIKAVELSQTEMKETQGEWIPNAIGAIAGGYAGGFGYLAAGGKDMKGYWAAVGGGAAAGAFSPVTGVGSAAAALSSGFLGAYTGTVLSK